MDFQSDQYLNLRRVERRARSLGSAFKLKREEMGKSLRDISEETSIPERLLQQLKPVISEQFPAPLLYTATGPGTMTLGLTWWRMPNS